ncbi:Serine/threonine protein kinase [Pseudonocardia thermophila]|uniref:non-specific serine/threonine protein kinase n=1 Tax=Pseudonocardia thermophila TaxID=1848 RepID=A0A1M6NK03_PSETH|nr:serine/threonine-protein kinase [Pseudonocardia thermophila]SHJ96071.1 Serine/threonine protein kinase [Pseudonocardia thermophila]
MDGLAALLAGVLAGLRRFVASLHSGSDICPGDWSWALTIFGVLVGLFPTAGLVTVALLRRRIGPRYGVPESAVLIGAGLVTAGLMPLLAAVATGRVFEVAFAGTRVAGLTKAQQDTLGVELDCIGMNQARYLGAGTVREAFDPDDPVRLAISVLLLALVPIAAALFVALQARLALRRGPSWPAKFFWAPVLALAVLTGNVPAGTMWHLWLGIVAGTVLGVPAVLMCGAPPREVAARRTPVSVRGAVPAGPVSRRPPAPPTPRTGHPAPRSGAVAVTGARPAGGPARFRLIRKLGSGGFGGVWLAHDAKLGHLVALKAAHAPDGETEERIRREAKALAAIRHPHCVRIYDLVPARSDPGLADLDGMVIVMGYVDGISLGELVREKGVLDDVAAARVWLSLAGALHAAHQRGVMHRDVKPGNVIVDGNGLAHLIDFGIARRSGDATLTQAGFVLGTPDFLAPEVACGDRATPASDGWQLAATVSYALTGHPPRGSHPDAVSGLRAAAAGAPLTHLPQRTAHLALLRATLDTAPEHRPTLPEVQAALAQWLRRVGAAVDGPVTSTDIRVR